MADKSKEQKPVDNSAMEMISRWESNQAKELQGQTSTQPVVWRCMNPDCAPKPGLVPAGIGINEPIGGIHSPSKRFHDFKSEHSKCPKCGCESPTVQKRSLIHLLLRDNMGPIVGEHGLRWFIACSPKREHLATHDNGEACTGDSTAANCPGCLKVIGSKVVISGKALGV